MEVKLTLPKELYDWAEKMAHESNKSVEQLIEDAVGLYKSDIESGTNSKHKKRDFRFK